MLPFLLPLDICTHPREPRLPPVADRLDPRRHVAERLRHGDEANLAAVALPPHESRALQRAKVLHDGLPRDGKVARERRQNRYGRPRMRALLESGSRR